MGIKMFGLIFFLLGFLFGEILISVIKRMFDDILKGENLIASDFYKKKSLVCIFLLVKILAGLFLSLCYLKFGFSLIFIFGFLFLCCLIIISATDFYFMFIFDEIIFFLGFLSLILCVLGFNKIIFFERVLGFFLISIFMLIINFFRRESFGLADIKLIAISGFVFGYKNNFLVFFMPVFSAAIISCLMILFKKKNFCDCIAFAPYICISMAVNFFCGAEIMAWYKNFLFLI